MNQIPYRFWTQPYPKNVPFAQIKYWRVVGGTHNTARLMLARKFEDMTEAVQTAATLNNREKEMVVSRKELLSAMDLATRVHGQNAFRDLTMCEVCKVWVVEGDRCLCPQKLLPASTEKVALDPLPMVSLVHIKPMNFSADAHLGATEAV